MTKKLFDEYYEKFVADIHYIEMSISLLDSKIITFGRYCIDSKDDRIKINTYSESGRSIEVIVPYESIVAVYLE